MLSRLRLAQVWDEGGGRRAQRRRSAGGERQRGCERPQGPCIIVGRRKVAGVRAASAAA